MYKPPTPLEPRKYPNHVQKVEDAILNKLLEEVKQGKIEAQLEKGPPLEEIDFDKKKLILEFGSKLVDVEFERTIKGEKGTLRTLPSYQGAFGHTLISDVHTVDMAGRNRQMIEVIGTLTSRTAEENVVRVVD